MREKEKSLTRILEANPSLILIILKTFECLWLHTLHAKPRENEFKSFSGQCLSEYIRQLILCPHKIQLNHSLFHLFSDEMMKGLKRQKEAKNDQKPTRNERDKNKSEETAKDQSRINPTQSKKETKKLKVNKARDGIRARAFWEPIVRSVQGGATHWSSYSYDRTSPLQPVAPPSLDYILGPENPHTPPVPQDEDEREPMFVQAHDPDYVPEPIYPKYIPLEEDHEFPAEEQPLPLIDSPIAESPGYVTVSDPKEDPRETRDE
ncbi:hypothetical protein Tco_0252271 [Tanacetum coccineum]